MDPAARRWFLAWCAVAAVAVLLRRRLRAAARWAREVARRARLARALPGPEPGVGEHPLLGHAAAPPFVPKGLPLNATTITENLIEVLIERARSTDDPVMRILGCNSRMFPWVTRRVIVFILSEDAVRFILGSANQHMFEKGEGYEISSQLIGDGVLAAGPGFPHGHQRPVMEMGFKNDVLSGALPKVYRTADELCNKIAAGAAASGDGAWEFQVPELMLKLTMDVIGRVAFNFDFGSVTAARTEDAPLYGPFQNVLKGLSRRALAPWLQVLRHVPLKMNREFDRSMERISVFARGIVAKRVEENRWAGKDIGGSFSSRSTSTGSDTSDAAARPRDLIDAMIFGNERHRRGEVEKAHLTEQEIVDNIQTSLFAGHDTTAAALSWLMHLLATHPEWQTRVRDEIVERVGPRGDPTYDDLEELSALNACVAETLRLYPSAGFGRRALVDVDFGGGVVVPAGSEIGLAPIILHRNPRHFPDPDAFKPERWADMLAEREPGEHARAASLQARMTRYSMRHPYFPFSHGIRNCVGKPLAIMEIRVVIAKVLQRFRLDPAPDPDFRPLPVVIMTFNPKSIRVRATPLA